MPTTLRKQQYLRVGTIAFFFVSLLPLKLSPALVVRSSSSSSSSSVCATTSKGHVTHTVSREYEPSQGQRKAKRHAHGPARKPTSKLLTNVTKRLPVFDTPHLAWRRVWKTLLYRRGHRNRPPVGREREAVSESPSFCTYFPDVGKRLDDRFYFMFFVGSSLRVCERGCAYVCVLDVELSNRKTRFILSSRSAAHPFCCNHCF